MFDVSWSELLILAIVTLIFVGPKDLPVFLGTLGRYAGAVRKQAAEFRRHFDDAMREAELDQMRKDVEAMTHDMNESVMSATRSVAVEEADARAAISAGLSAVPSMPAPEVSAIDPVSPPTTDGPANETPATRAISQHG